MCNQNQGPFANSRDQIFAIVDELPDNDLTREEFSNTGTRLVNAINLIVSENFPNLQDGGDAGERANIERRLGLLVATRLTERLANNVTFDETTFQFILERN